jgi:quercetin dioxygenase-like cupin family protein
MIRAGDTLWNPISGERIHFIETSRETNGERVLIEVTVEAGGFVPAAHVHPGQSERFDVLDGVLSMKVGRRKLELSAGESAVVEPGVAHRFWNKGDGVVRFRTEVRPALQFEQLLETMCALAADGKTNRKGMPNPFRLAVIAQAHFDDVRLPFPPAALQRAALAMGAPLGRLVGYGATYEPVGQPIPATA